MSPTRTKRPPARDEPMLATDPIALGKSRALWRGIGRTLVGLLAFATIWAAVFGLGAFFGWPTRHSMYLGLVASTFYAIVRERRRRAASTTQILEHRRRWRAPIAWPRRGRTSPAVTDPDAAAPRTDAPQRRLGPRGGRPLSNRSWGEVLLWIIVVAVAITAYLAYVAYSSILS